MQTSKNRDTMNVALLQMTSYGLDQHANLKKGIEFCHQAKKQGADIALFPEMWNIGYATKHEDWYKYGISQKSDFFISHQKLAKSLNMAIGITYLEEFQPAPRNTISLIDRLGNVILTYAKVHICAFSREIKLTPGDRFFVSDLNTEKGKVKVGSMICFDREFSESARILMLKGAELVLIPNACEIEKNRMAALQASAFENMFATALTNYASPQENGYSIAFDGMAFDEKGNSRDMQSVRPHSNEGILIAKFNIEALRMYRKTEPWGAAYRKPALYDELIRSANTKSEPL
ncbi:MAG: hypothetical protein A3F17_08055 [Gammaproteobacteria bacterium RIFCSPHIGHO2_12_FULL_41_15]|nr:MAG: hypothetical protein A3F17_08055 [Gammaproteobacteria bacterium RIFCSPHIGHO2_12_FULL_41_15]